MNCRTATSPRKLAMLILLGVPALHAQTGGPANADPFTEWNASLTRALDIQLAQLAERSNRVATQATSVQPNAEPPDRSPWAERFAGSSPDRLATARERFRALEVDAARIFAQEGVPLEWLHIAAVESNYDPQALSPKGARGVWQLMPETARRFGLRVNGGVDERILPQQATRAAARYLRELYLQFGDWLLALAAYNAGEGQIAAAIERADTRDYWQLAERRLLPEETRRYVLAVLLRAAALPTAAR